MDLYREICAMPSIPLKPARRHKLRTREMSPRLLKDWPEAVTLLVTNEDGSQIVFFRPNEASVSSESSISPPPAESLKHG